MAIEINREFEVFMREMVKAQECAQENIESVLRRLIAVTVNSCATMYGFSAQEALKRLNTSGEIIEVLVVPISQQKELEKAEKLRRKEFEKTKKAEVQAFEKTEKLRRFAFESAKKNKLKELGKTEKVNEFSERNQMKEQDIASKAIEKAAKLKLKKKKKTVTKKVKDSDCESLASTVLMTDSEDEEPRVLFQNIPLIKELNSIRNTKVQKKLSSGVKLARQILDI
jgi:hypothetical protein